MQHTHTHKAVTGRVEAKRLLSRRRQSNYRRFMCVRKVPKFQFSIENCAEGDRSICGVVTIFVLSALAGKTHRDHFVP